MEDILGTKEVGAWRSGVIGSTEAALLPGTASPRGLNSALALSRTGVPYVQKRMGVNCLTPEGINNDGLTTQLDPLEDAAIRSQFTAPDYSHYLFTANPTWASVLAPDNSTSLLINPDLGSPGLGASIPAAPVACAQFNQSMFAFGQTVGGGSCKFGSSFITRIGIVRPDASFMSGAAGSAGLHNGTYELRVTFGNTVTGFESSASDTAPATVSVANKQIDWTGIPTSLDDPQVNVRYLYVRNVDTQTQFYRVGTVPDNITTSFTTSALDADALVAAPNRTENDPPPFYARFPAIYRGRLFLGAINDIQTTGTSSGLYWSKINNPEAFDPLNFDSVNPTGEDVTGIFADHDGLIITYYDRTYMLRGEVGDAYTIDLIDPTIGCLSHASFVSAEGYTYWWSQHGLVRWDGSGPIQRIGLDLYGDPSDRVNMEATDVVTIAADHSRTTLYIALPGLNETRATFILPFNYHLGVFEASKWDPMDIGSLALRNKDDGDEVILGSYIGQVFRVWSGSSDGIRPGTDHTGTFTPVTSSITSITDAGAAFDMLGRGLLERKLTVLDADGLVVASTRPRITANTGTSITFTPAIVGLDTTATYTYVIGGPDFQFDTAWRDFGNIFLKKRFEFLHTLTKGLNPDSPTYIDVDFDYDAASSSPRQRSLTLNTGVGWDDALWDVDIWDLTDNIMTRTRIARVGTAYRLRFRNPYTDSPFALVASRVQAAGQTYKR